MSAAEHALGLLLALSRNIPQAHVALKAGRWERAARRARAAGEDAVHSRVRPRRAAARQACARSRHARDRVRPVRRGRPLSRAGRRGGSKREEAFAEADFVTLHLPLADETRGTLDAAAFAAMQDGVRIVNTARGELIDEQALLDALESGKVAGGGARRVRDEPYERASARARQRHRHAASCGVDGGGAGPGRGDRGRAGRSSARRGSGHERRQQSGRRRGGPRGARAIRSACGKARASRDGARRRRAPSASSVYGGLADHDTRLLTAAALNGAFQGRTEQPVNYVNAPLVAAERGIGVEEETRRSSRDYMSLFVVSAAEASASPGRRSAWTTGTGSSARSGSRSRWSSPR